MVCPPGFTRDRSVSIPHFLTLPRPSRYDENVPRPQNQRARGAIRLFLLALAVLASAAFTPNRFQKIFHSNAAAVVRIRATTPSLQRHASAFLVRSDGTMLTSAAAVAGADSVVIVDAQGRDLAVEVIASNSELGVAVLRAPSAGDLPTVKLGTSRALRDGDWVVGISHGDDGEASAVAGCVSQLGRARPAGTDGDPSARRFVLDAATAPGGPVLNLDGEVVGVAVQRKGVRRAVAVAIDDVKPFLLGLRAAAPPAKQEERS